MEAADPAGRSIHRRVLALLTARLDFQPPAAAFSRLSVMLTRFTAASTEEMVNVAGGKRLPAEVMKEIVPPKTTACLCSSKADQEVLDPGWSG